MKLQRRSFLGLLGSAPLAAKVAADNVIAKTAGLYSGDGIGSLGIGLVGGNGPPYTDEVSKEPFVPYEQRLIQVADYIKLAGIPEVIEFELRDQARNIHALDPDIACKATWSMSVKLMTQRQRNYQRALDRIHRSGWQHRKRSALKKLLGFEWPW